MTGPWIAPRYLARFACIAERCPDACCHGWNVAIDPPTAARWRAALPAERLVALDPQRRVLRLRDDGTCPLLDADRLCAVQRALGPEALADTCALFPRVLQTAGLRREATATLACPEVARLSLTTDDAHDLVALPEQPVLRRPPHTEVSARSAAWVAAGPALRDRIDQVLAGPGAPTAARLFALARLGERSRAFFHPACGADAARRLATDGEALLSPAGVAAAEAALSDHAPVAFAAPAMVCDILAARLATATAPRLAALIERALAGCDDADGAVTSGGRRLSPARLWDLHGARLDALPPAVLARLDALDAAWARHVWRQRWHLFATDLFAHGLLHLVGRATGRVLVAAHPRVADDVDGAMVEIVYLYTRHLEHGGLRRQLSDRLRAGGLETLAVARSLLLL